MTKKNQTAIIILISILVITGCLFAQKSDNMINEMEVSIIELTSFKLGEGMSERKFIEVAQIMQDSFLNHQSGFINRILVKGKTEWTDIVFWENKESLQNAMQKAEFSPEAAPFMQMIDLNSVKMNLSEVKLKGN